MKRILAITLTLVMLLAALTGCMASKNPSGSEGEQPKQAQYIIKFKCGICSVVNLSKEKPAAFAVGFLAPPAGIEPTTNP